MSNKSFITAVVFVCFFFPLGVYSQRLPDVPLVEQFFGKSGQDKIVDLACAPNGQLVAAGISSKGNNGGDDILWAVLDKELKVVFSKFIGRNNDDGVNSINKTPDGLFLMAGYSTMPTGKSKKSNDYFGGRDGWLLFIDEKGNTVREFILGDSGADEFIKVFPTNDNHLMLFGNSDANAWMVKIDLAGNLYWQKKFNFYQLPSTIKDVEMVHDSAFYFTGYVEDGQSRQMWIGSVDLSGDKIMEKVTPAKDGREGVALFKMENDNIGVAGNVLDERGRQNAFFLKMDGKGNTISFNIMGGREFEAVNNGIALANGDIFIIGSSKSFERGSRRDRIWMVHVNSKGEIEEQAFYGSKTKDIGTTILQLHNGSIVTAGYSNQQILKSSQAWFALLTKSRKPVLPVSDLEFKIGNLQYTSNLDLKGGDRIYIPVRFRNIGAKAYYHLKAKIELIGRDSNFHVDVYLPPVKKFEKEGMRYIPFQLPPKVAPGTYQAKVQMYIDLTPLGTPTMRPVIIGSSNTPKFTIEVESKPDYLKAAESRAITLVLKNDGSLMAPDCNLSFLGSEGLYLEQNDLFIGDMQPGEEKRIELPIALQKDFYKDSVLVLARVSDGTFKFTAQSVTQIPVLSEMEKSAAQKKQPSNFVNAIWITPNPDHYEQAAIVWHEPEILLQVKVISNKPIEKQHFCLMVNGQPCASGAKMDEVALKGSSTSKTYLQKLKLRENEEVVLQAAVDNDAGKTITEPVRLIYSPRKPNLHIISIGVPASDLKYTSKDARDFARAMLGENAAFQNIFADTLFAEHNTTKTEILKTLRRLQYRYQDRQIMEKDLLIVFVSSHGISEAAGQFRMAASDYDGPFLQETSLDFEKELLNYLEPIKCNKLLLIDACHSGSIGQETFPDQASGTGIEALARNKPDITVLMSCSADEFSYEDDAWENGAFTKSILDAFRTHRDRLDLNTLFKEIKDRIPKLVNGKRPKPKTSQNPVLLLQSDLNPIILFEAAKK